MARLTWATKDQDEWLKARIDAFVECHKAKTLSKKFWPNVLKEFRQKWPAEPPTAADIANAASKEAAVTKLRVNMEKRIQAWFHNHTRNVTSNATSAPRGVLELKSKTRKLQAWQAYHALTYNQWKDDIDKEWTEYIQNWEETHPDEKMPKNRFIFMVEYMRKKYTGESDEMKRKVEEYRDSNVGPVPADDNEARNIEYQKAIDKPPRTLAMVGESIMEQTGWNISFLVGGPAPDDGGRITTYLGHFGRNKKGLTFQKYLTPTEYDEHLLAPFDNFLHSCFPKEDQLARRLPEIEELESRDTSPSIPKTKNPEPPKATKAVDPAPLHTQKVTDHEKPASAGEKAENPTNNEALEVDTREMSSDVPPESLETKGVAENQPSDYLERRQKNIAENKKLLAELGLGSTSLEGLKPRSKRATPPKKIEKGKGKGEDEDGRKRRESLRNTDSENDSQSDKTSSLTAHAPAVSAHPTINVSPHSAANAFSHSAAKVSPHPTANASPEDSTIPSIITANTLTSPLSIATLTPASPKKGIAFDLIQAIIHSPVPTPSPTAADSRITVEDNSFENSACSDPSLSSISTILQGDAMSTTNSESLAAATEPLATETQPGVKVNQDTPGNNCKRTEPAATAASCPSIGEDVEMSDSREADNVGRAERGSPSDVQQRDENVPKFLTLTLGSLRGACKDARWQALVTELVAFEKSEPTTGKLSTTARPDEVQVWIKGKKKEEVPKIKGGSYGKRFTAWWKGLQPKWRIGADGLLSQQVPSDEDWLGLKKGGSAGVYTIIMALSWWVRLESIDTSELSTIVDDVCWVLRQFTAPSSSSAGTAAQKRSRDTEVDESDRKRKSRLTPPSL